MSRTSFCDFDASMATSYAKLSSRARAHIARVEAIHLSVWMVVCQFKTSLVLLLLRIVFFAANQTDIHLSNSRRCCSHICPNRHWRRRHRSCRSRRVAHRRRRYRLFVNAQFRYGDMRMLRWVFSLLARAHSIRCSQTGKNRNILPANVCRATHCIGRREIFHSSSFDVMISQSCFVQFSARSHSLPLTHFVSLVRLFFLVRFSNEAIIGESGESKAYSIQQAEQPSSKLHQPLLIAACRHHTDRS